MSLLLNFSLDSLCEILNPCLPHHHRFQGLNAPQDTSKDERSIILSALRATWHPSTFHPSHANSYTTPKKCPFTCKNLNWVASWEGIHSTPCAGPHSGRESFPNLDPFIPCGALLEEPHFPVFSASIHVIRFNH